MTVPINVTVHKVQLNKVFQCLHCPYSWCQSLLQEPPPTKTSVHRVHHEYHEQGGP